MNRAPSIPRLLQWKVNMLSHFSLLIAWLSFAWVHSASIAVPPSSDAFSDEAAAIAPDVQRERDLSGVGTGVLQITADGHILIALALEEPPRGLRLFHFVPESVDDTRLLPGQASGRFLVTHEVATGTSRVALDGQRLFAISLLDFGCDPRVADEAGAPLITWAAQIAAVHIGSRRPYGEPVGTPAAARLIELYIAEMQRLSTGLEDLSEGCQGCTAGGPGSGSCGIGGCSGNPSSCTVACRDNKWSCCKCTGSSSWASCLCCSSSGVP